MAADPATAPRYGVAGYPVDHSVSPQLHEAAYAQLGIDAVYQRLPIPPDLFAETVCALPGSGFCGINVTIPHKVAAAELASQSSAAVEAIGAANTLTFSDGEIHAENTDAPGLIAAIDRDLGGVETLVLGAGGTARAAVWALLQAGASVDIHNRTTERATQLADAVGGDVVEDPASGARYGLIVNTTAVGMDPETSIEDAQTQLRLNLTEVDNNATLVDFVYRPGGSPLSLAAQAHGLRVIDGRELLVRQGALSFELWFGRAAPLDAMRAAVRDLA